MRLEAAVVARRPDGTPYSPRYDDVYHSAEGGIAQARHVFLAGNALPARWARRRVFTIVETGFGLGLNFLSTWQAWRDDPARCGHLHFVSVEQHPFPRAHLATLHASYPGLSHYSAQLQAAWPELVPGMHRLHFEAGRVTLTLAFADAAVALQQLRCKSDAFFLDGFAPDCNPGMWTADVFGHCARLACRNATAATYTTARTVRDGLAAAGFSVSRRPGCGRKRHMLVAERRAPDGNESHHALRAPRWPERSAIVIGAGLAGAGVCERLAARGWRVTLLERLAVPAGSTSGLHAGIVHPHLSRDDSVLSRLSRHGFLYGLSAWRALESAGHRLLWQQCGVAQPARHEAEALQMMRVIDQHGYPESYACYLDRDALSRNCGAALGLGGYWFPQGGWLQAATLVRALLAQSAATARYSTTVEKLERAGDRWRALGPDGSLLAEAPVVVLANAADATRLAPVGHALRSIRGQLTYLPADTLPVLRSVIAGRTCVLPPVEGITVAGGTYDIGDEETRTTSAAHQRNLAGLMQFLPAGLPPVDPATLAGAVGFRAVSPDRLPLIGAMPDLDAMRVRAGPPQRARLADLPRLPGLYGAFGYASRGLTWAALGGELVASLIEHEPCPLEASLADAVDPARMALKTLRRRQPPRVQVNCGLARPAFDP